MLISYDWEVCVVILFRHAQIYDGTGQKPFLGDVLVRNDRIAEVGQNLEVPEDTEILEADGKLLSPGFIDIHRYADVQPLLNSKSEAELRQGITTAVSGTRGFWVRFLAFLREYAFERHVVTPEDAICKMTFASAKRFSFTDRGKSQTARRSCSANCSAKRSASLPAPRSA